MTPASAEVPTATPSASPRERRVLRLLLAGLVLAMSMATIDTQIVATALPTIVADLHGLPFFAWVSTAYLLALAVVTPLAGKLGDLLGRRLVFMAAVSVFLAGSALCGLAQTMEQLIAFRVVQGIGAGGLTVSVFAIIGELFDPRQRARYQGLFAAVFAVSGLAGPVVGGVLTQYLGWRAVFYVNLPLGAVTLATTLAYLHLPGPTRQPRFDVSGTLLLGGAVSCLVLLSSRIGTSVDGQAVTGLAATAVLLLVGWLLVERRAAEPVVPLTLFRARGFPAAAIIAFVGGAAGLGLVSYLVLFFQRGTGASPTGAGLLLLPGTVGIVAGNALAGRVVSRTGRYQPLLIVSMAGGAAATALLATMTVGTPWGLSAIYLLLYGLAAGLSQQVVVVAAQAAVPLADLGAATGAVTFARIAGSSFGIALFGAVLNARLPADLTAVVPSDAYASALSTVFATAIPLLLVGLAATLLKPVDLDAAQELDPPQRLGDGFSRT